MISFSELGATMLAGNCSFLEGNPYLKLIATQRKLTFYPSSGLCGILAVRWLQISFQQAGKQMPPSFQMNPKTFSHVTGQPKLRGFSPPSQAAACAVKLLPTLTLSKETAFFLGCLAHTLKMVNGTS